MKNNKGNGLVGGVILAAILVIVVITLIIGATRVPVGQEGIVYSVNGGVQDETLSQGWHIVAPTKHVKLFTVSNEQLVLTKDKRDGSSGDDSFYVTTSDNASIKVSFQMSYRYIPDTLVDAYKKFKGMDGEDIMNKRVRTVLKSKISEITTDYSLMDIYSGNRSEINEKITKYLDDKFNSEFGIEVMDASIIDVHPSKKLTEAINAKVEALQAKEKAEADQEKVKVEAETKLIKANNKADIKRAEAQGDADALTIQAKAEAEANKTISKSLDSNVLQNKYYEKWDGKLPKTMAGESGIMVQTK